MALQVTGKLIKFLEVQTGVTKDGGTWSKQQFLVETETEHNKLHCFEVFGNDKVENLTKYQKEGDNVTVKFNVSTNEYKGKYYTSLSAWKITNNSYNKKDSQPTQAPQNNNFPPAPDFSQSEEVPDLPF